MSDRWGDRTGTSSGELRERRRGGEETRGWPSAPFPNPADARGRELVPLDFEGGSGGVHYGYAAPRTRRLRWTTGRRRGRAFARCTFGMARAPPRALDT